MTQVFREDGSVVPVTRVKAGPCVVTQVKTAERDNVSAVQIGFGDQKQFRLRKAQQGHLQGLKAVKVMRDIATKSDDHGLERGDTFTANIFEKGEKVEVVGTSKGKGFQGVVKRWNFKGSPKTHGHKDQHRMPGSIGATGPARVFKGTKMGGHMGVDRVTVKNLEILDIDLENGELLIKGAIPGARGGLLIIKTSEGKIEPVREAKAEPAKEKAAPKAEAEEAPATPETVEEAQKEDSPAEAEVPVAATEESAK